MNSGDVVRVVLLLVMSAIYVVFLIGCFVPFRELGRYIRQLHAWITYRRALAAFDDAQHFKALAAQRAEEGAALERASTVLRHEARA